MGPIFNEKVIEKWNLWGHKQCTDTLFKDKKSTSAATKKKKKKKKAEMRWKQNVDAISRIQTLPESWILIRMILSLFLKQKKKRMILSLNENLSNGLIKCWFIIIICFVAMD